MGRCTHTWNSGLIVNRTLLPASFQGREGLAGVARVAGRSEGDGSRAVSQEGFLQVVWTGWEVPWLKLSSQDLPTGERTPGQ